MIKYSSELDELLDLCDSSWDDTQFLNQFWILQFPGPVPLCRRAHRGRSPWTWGWDPPGRIWVILVLNAASVIVRHPVPSVGQNVPPLLRRLQRGEGAHVRATLQNKKLSVSEDIPTLGGQLLLLNDYDYDYHPTAAVVVTSTLTKQHYYTTTSAAAKSHHFSFHIEVNNRGKRKHLREYVTQLQKTSVTVWEKKRFH